MRRILPLFALLAVTCLLLLIVLPPAQQKRDLASLGNPNAACYDRALEPSTAVVDSHLHFRSFGGESLPFDTTVDILKQNGVLVATVMGIGQILPEDSDCTYYTECPGTPVAPNTKNDLINAADFVKNKSNDLHLVLSMTFPDLAHPETVLATMTSYERKHPGVFQWMGEVNLVKQALFNNQHQATDVNAIQGWADFMHELELRHIPLTLHSDLGSMEEPTKYLPLLHEVLTRYPNNRIVLAHMGLSRESHALSAPEHIAIMRSLLTKYPQLMLDISWRILYDFYFINPKDRDLYLAFIHDYSTRILPGTDFVASSKKTLQDYEETLKLTSYLFPYLNDEAFRHIALGENYFRLLDLNYTAPSVCTGD